MQEMNNKKFNYHTFSWILRRAGKDDRSFSLSHYSVILFLMLTDLTPAALYPHLTDKKPALIL